MEEETVEPDEMVKVGNDTTTFLYLIYSFYFSRMTVTLMS